MLKSLRLKSVVASIALLTASSIFAGNHSEISADRQKLMDHLEQSRKAFLASIEGVSEEQWKYRPAADKWSIAEVAEHITLAESMAEQLLLKGAAAAVPGDKRSSMADEKISAMLLNRDRKAQAPEVLRPASKFASPSEVVAAFEEARAKTIARAKDYPHDMRAVLLPNPVFGEVDLHQSYLFMSGHTLRHTAQIEEVKKSDGYPAK